MSTKTLIQEGISRLQTDELIIQSKSDLMIKKFTSDLKRFKDKRTFNTWKRNKKIFILTDEQERLLGFIWFEKKGVFLKNPPKKLESYKTTFAIRLYKRARGKGLAREFMKDAFMRIDDRNIWLSTVYNNKTAINLYTKFGFKPVAEEGKRLYMIYENKK